MGTLGLRPEGWKGVYYVKVPGSSVEPALCGGHQGPTETLVLGSARPALPSRTAVRKMVYDPVLSKVIVILITCDL
jgi:hypothetical protein